MGGISGHSSVCLDDEPERSGEEAKPAVRAVNFGRLEPPAAEEEAADKKLSCMGDGTLELGYRYPDCCRSPLTTRDC